MVLKIRKANGDVEDFSDYKLNHSLKQAGVPKDERQYYIKLLKKKLSKETHTSELHDIVLKYLKATDTASAARYNLRRAIMQLGPTGFPFEQYVSRLLAHQEFEVETNQMVKGHCITHEVDIVAHKEKVRYMIECKFHNQSGSRSDSKSALYIWARFKDISEAWKASKKIEEKFHEAWLVTNTKVTTDAEAYAKCRGLKVVSWYRPYRNSLKDMIVKTGLWPITCLGTLDSETKNELIKKKVVLCTDLIETDKGDLKEFSRSLIRDAQEEAEFVCQIPEIADDADENGKE